jgi:hypothetical protein
MRSETSHESGDEELMRFVLAGPATEQSAGKRALRDHEQRAHARSGVMKKALILGILVFLGGSRAAIAQGDEASGHVRPRDAIASLLLQYGMSESPTFRRLTEELAQSNVIVYVDVRREAAHGMGGVLHFMSDTHGVRWVRVVVDTGTLDFGRSQGLLVQLTAILGHELQHAREVAQATVIRDEEGFAELFRTIGIELQRNQFDTHAARAAGQVIEAEIRGGIRKVAIVAQR